jgi:hypothetical protein
VPPWRRLKTTLGVLAVVVFAATVPARSDVVPVDLRAREAPVVELGPDDAAPLPVVQPAQTPARRAGVRHTVKPVRSLPSVLPEATALVLVTLIALAITIVRRRGSVAPPTALPARGPPRRGRPVPGHGAQARCRLVAVPPRLRVVPIGV